MQVQLESLTEERQPLAGLHMAVVVPLRTREDAVRLERAAELWSDPGLAPCAAAIPEGEGDALGAVQSASLAFGQRCERITSPAFVPRPHRPFATAPSDTSVDLIAYQEEHLLSPAQLAAAVGRAAVCFRRLIISGTPAAAVAAATSSSGSGLYYRLMLRLSGLRLYNYWFLVEADTEPLTPIWLEYMVALVPPLGERVWVKGSDPRHPCGVRCKAEGGNRYIGRAAIYNGQDALFRTFVEVARNASSQLPFERALWAARINSIQTPEALGFPRKRHAISHLFQFSDWLVSDANISTPAALRKYPCTLLFHRARDHAAAEPDLDARERAMAAREAAISRGGGKAVAAPDLADAILFATRAAHAAGESCADSMAQAVCHHAASVGKCRKRIMFIKGCLFSCGYCRLAAEARNASLFSTAQTSGLTLGHR